MKRTVITSGFKSPLSPLGKVNGIVENKQQLQEVIDALAKLDVEEIEVLDGTQGEVALEEERGPLFKYFLGDVEPTMLQKYLQAVREGQIVFAAHVRSDNAEEVALQAKNHGAYEVVHFGEWVITNY